MTTNLGAPIPRPPGSRPIRAHRRLRRGDQGVLSPRRSAGLDAIHPVQAAAPAALEQIVELELAKLRRAARPRRARLGLTLTSAARARLAQLGYDPKLGAAPAAPHIEDLVVAPIAEPHGARAKLARRHQS